MCKIPKISYSISRRTINTLHSKDGLHCTNKYLFLLFHKANLMLTVKEQMLSLIDRCIIVLPPNTPYSFSFGTTCQYLRFSVLAQDESADKLLYTMTHKYLQRIVLDSQSPDTIFPSAETLLALQTHFFPIPSVAAIYGATLVSQIILGIYHLQCKNRQIAIPIDEKKLSDQITKYLAENHTKKITLDDLSLRYFHSKYYISRSFHTETGETITHYLNRLRIEHACQLLNDTDKSINEIADSCGFGSSQHFYAVFRQLLGQTPLQFKKNIENT